MVALDNCPTCLVGVLDKSENPEKLACNNCHNYFEDSKKGVARSVARATDPDGYEHKVTFIKVGEYWEIE